MVDTFRNTLLVIFVALPVMMIGVFGTLASIARAIIEISDNHRYFFAAVWVVVAGLWLSSFTALISGVEQCNPRWTEWTEITCIES